MNRKSQYISGLKAGIPVILAFISVAVAFAAMSFQAGLTGWQTIAMSAMVFAGASQMIAVSMIAQGAGMLTIVLATFIINLRHLIMSTCVMNRMKAVPRRQKLLAAFGVTDESFAIFTTAADQKSPFFFFLGLITTLYSSWVIGTAIGCVAMQFLPPIISGSLGITLYAMFIGLLVPNVKGNARMGLVVLMTAALSFIFSRFLPSSWAIIFATLIGGLIGMFIIHDKKEANCNPAARTEDAE